MTEKKFNKRDFKIYKTQENHIHKESHVKIWSFHYKICFFLKRKFSTNFYKLFLSERKFVFLILGIDV
jgi:hypothetical protein